MLSSENCLAVQLGDFSVVKEEIIEFLSGAELIIHNASFDVGFLDAELKRARERRRIADISTVTDSLALARTKYPGQKNNLDALCKRLGIDNTARTLHGALLDAEILAEVYLAMTGGQASLVLDAPETIKIHAEQGPVSEQYARPERLRILEPTDEEREAHQAMLARLTETSESKVDWG